MAESFAAHNLLNFGFIGLFFAFFIGEHLNELGDDPIVGTGHWLRVSLIFLLFKAFTSETGLRCLKCLPRDISGVVLLAKLKWKIKVAFNRNQPLNYYFQKWVRETPDKPCVIEIETGRVFTFKQINELANKYANYFQVIYCYSIQPAVFSKLASKKAMLWRCSWRTMRISSDSGSV